MGTKEKTIITVGVEVDAPVGLVWEFWTSPQHIMKWNHASDDWHTTSAENELHVGGKFSSRMEAKNGSEGFDFGGIYKIVIINKKLEYTLDDGRNVRVIFFALGNKTKIAETFEAESINPVEMQRAGWQAILNNFKKYAEENKNK